MPETLAPPVTVTVVDTVTGRVTVVTEPACDATWWAEGNGSCDCNRALLTDAGLYEALVAAQGDAPTPRMPWQRTCLGHHRFVVVALTGTEGLYSLAELNAGYPADTIALACRQVAEASHAD
jgi:hypothetical protein